MSIEQKTILKFPWEIKRSDKLPLVKYIGCRGSKHHFLFSGKILTIDDDYLINYESKNKTND